MPGPGTKPAFADYEPVADRVEKFYDRYPDGRINTAIVEHDAERGFILMRAEVYRLPDDALPAATGHAFELKAEGYVNKTSYIENCETGAVGRALAMLNFKTKRGIASREEMEKSERAQPRQATGDKPASEQAKADILALLEDKHPGDRRAQRATLVALTGKDSRDDLTQVEAMNLIKKLQARG
jgi:hypothetical protein